MTTVGKKLEIAVALLSENELVAIPTETVYGLAGNALNESAVVKIYSAKDRPSFNPLIIHVATVAAIKEYAELDPISQQLAEAFMPGPFTLLLPKKSIIPDLVTAGSSKVAVRIPRHPLTLRLLQQLNFPLAAPSANPFGYVSPTTAKHVLDGLNNRVDYILDGGPCEVGVESTIAEVKDGQIILHRLGAITAEEMEAVTGLPVVQKVGTESFETPGQMKSHYATKIPLYLGDIPTLLQEHKEKNIATISFCKSYEGLISGHQYILSPKCDINEAAQHLFAVMRNIDEFNFDLIIAEPFPDKGLGRAINDRLERAQVIHK
jgi:L-threonylcarbamoyladenylate synthase